MSAIGRDRVLAFRLSRHHLTERLGPRSLVRAAAACGIQETPLGSAAVALVARVDALTPAAPDRALIRDRTLVHLWSLRGAPYVIPSRDLPVFTAGALPVDRNSFDAFLGGWGRPIAAAGLDHFDLLDRLTAAARAILDGRTMDVNELRDALLRRVRTLSRITRPKEARHDMPENLYRALGLAGAACIVEGRGTSAVLARTDQWLGAKLPDGDRTSARAELARRFLRCYGPSTPQQFAEWTARSLRDAKAAFELVEEELTDVDLGGRERGWVLAADLAELESPPSPSGVRLLPAQDPYLQQRDRATVLPDARARKRVWQPVRGPGVVLAGGEIVGVWRARTVGAELEFAVEPFGRLSRAVRDGIEDEAQRVARVRGAEKLEVAFSER